MTPNADLSFPEEAGISPVPQGLYGLSHPFPAVFFVLHDASRDCHILIDARPADDDAVEAITEGFQSVACFPDFDAAVDAACRLGCDGHFGFEPVITTFEEARRIALRKTCGVGALMLVDPPTRPLIHYVR